MAGLITGVDFITVSTKDFAEARHFYANVLGLEESKRWGSMPAQEFETGNLTIAVMQSDAFGVEHSINSSPIESTWTISRAPTMLPDTVMPGRITVEWLEGEKLLLHRARND